MAFRILHGTVTIEADTIEDVQALVAVLDKPLLALSEKKPTKPARKPRATFKAARGASDGALEGRILEVLAEQGSLGPGELCEAVKAERYYVNIVLRTMEGAGKVRCEGSTSNRRWMLGKAKSKPLAVA